MESQWVTNPLTTLAFPIRSEISRVKWGNRYIIGKTVEHVDSKLHHVKDAAEAKRLFAEWFEWQCQRFPSWRHSIKLELGGHNLACWCAEGSPCHADVLFDLANRTQ
jgi:hypothetical protein